MNMINKTTVSSCRLQQFIYLLLLIFALPSMAQGAEEKFNALLDSAPVVIELSANSASAGVTHYSGSISGKKSWVRASRFADGSWQGLAIIDNNSYYVVGAGDNITLEDSINDKERLQCQHTQTANTNFSPVSALRHSLIELPKKRVALGNSCNLVDGICQFANLELLIDQSFKAALGSNPTAKIDSIINMMDGIYSQQLKVKFNLINSVFLDDSSNIFSHSNDSNKLLKSLFSRRCEQVYGTNYCAQYYEDYDHKTANPAHFIKQQNSMVQLLSGRKFNGKVAGLAYWGENIFCSAHAASVVSLIKDHKNRLNLPLIAMVMAHELGHNLNAVHDGEKSAKSCPDGKHLMQTTINAKRLPTEFSSCSVKDISKVLEKSQGKSCTVGAILATINQATLKSSYNKQAAELTLQNVFNINILKRAFYKNNGVLKVQITASGLALKSASSGRQNCQLNAAKNQALCIIGASNANFKLKFALAKIAATGQNLQLRAQILPSTDYRNVLQEAGSNTLKMRLLPQGKLEYISANAAMLRDKHQLKFSGSSSLDDNQLLVVKDGNRQLCVAYVFNHQWQCSATVNLSTRFKKLHIKSANSNAVSTDLTILDRRLSTALPNNSSGNTGSGANAGGGSIPNFDQSPPVNTGSSNGLFVVLLLLLAIFKRRVQP